MNAQTSTTTAFLLALRELDTPLTQEEKKILREIADQLDIQPKAWESFTEPLLLKMIAANPPLNQSYQLYKTKLDSLATIQVDLLPTTSEIEQLKPSNTRSTKGFKPQTEATAYNQQINNAVILIGRSEQPEESVKKLSLEKVKQILD